MYVIRSNSSVFISIHSLFFDSNPQIDESENLPKYLCDSCIIQLNVAYNFKRNSVESDIKIRQYIIEYGMSINTNQSSVANSNNLLVPASNFNAPPSPSSSSSGLNLHNGINGIINNNYSHTVDQSMTRTATEPFPFPISPFIIKEEPVDFETLSDITIETNTEIANDYRLNGRNKTSVNGSVTGSITGSMVTLNDKSLLISTALSDVDYMSAYLPTPSASEHSRIESTPSSIQNEPERGSLSSAGTAKPRSRRTKDSTMTLNATRSVDSDLAEKRRSTRNTSSIVTEIAQNKPRRIRETTVAENINVDSVDEEKPNARSLQRQLNKLEINMLTDERAPVRFDQRGSRTKEGVLEKKDYEKFFRNKRNINPLNNDARNEIEKKMLSRSWLNKHRPMPRSEMAKRSGSVRTRKVFMATTRSAKTGIKAMATSKPSGSTSRASNL